MHLSSEHVSLVPRRLTDDSSIIVVSEDEEKKPIDGTGFDEKKSADPVDSEASPTKKSKTSKRPACPFGASCYRKNPTHRTEQSHPDDSDYEEENDQTKADATKPVCPYGKTCYRKNPQHKRDYQH